MSSIVLSFALLFAPHALAAAPRPDVETSAVALVEEMSRQLSSVERAAGEAHRASDAAREECLAPLRAPLRRSVVDAVQALARAHAEDPDVRTQALASLRTLARVADAIARRATQCPRNQG